MTRKEARKFASLVCAGIVFYLALDAALMASAARSEVAALTSIIERFDVPGALAVALNSQARKVSDYAMARDLLALLAASVAIFGTAWAGRLPIALLSILGVAVFILDPLMTVQSMLNAAMTSGLAMSLPDLHVASAFNVQESVSTALDGFPGAQTISQWTSWLSDGAGLALRLGVVLASLRMAIGIANPYEDLIVLPDEIGREMQSWEFPVQDEVTHEDDRHLSHERLEPTFDSQEALTPA